MYHTSMRDFNCFIKSQWFEDSNTSMKKYNYWNKMVHPNQEDNPKHKNKLGSLVQLRLMHLKLDLHFY